MSNEVTFVVTNGLISDRSACELRWSDLTPETLAQLVRSGAMRSGNTVRQGLEGDAADAAERAFWQQVGQGHWPSRGGSRVSLDVQCWREVAIDQLVSAGMKSGEAGKMARNEPDKAIREITRHLVKKAGAEATKARIDANTDKVADSLKAKADELVKLRQQKDDAIDLDI